MAFDYKTLESVEESDLALLLQIGAPEGKQIEYKERLNLDSPEDKRKFLKHVASFANASGGHLIYGIREDKGIPVEICGLELDDADRLKVRVTNIVRDGIEPRLSLETHTVRLRNQKFALVLRIPKGWRGPSFVKEEGRFYSRHGASTYMMDFSELRTAFLQSDGLGERIRAFRVERLTIIDAGQSPFKCLTKPYVVAHIIPFQSINPGFQTNWRAITTNQVQLGPFFSTGGNFGYNLEGHLTSLQDFETQLCDNYSLVFRNGIVEAVESRILEPLKVPKHLDGPLLVASLVTWVERYLACSTQLGLAAPFAVSFCLIGVSGYALKPCLTHNLFGPTRIDRNEVLIQEVVINELSENIPTALKPIFDSLWNAGGYAECNFQLSWL